MSSGTIRNEGLLASYGQRVVAYLVDKLLGTGPLIVFAWASGYWLLGRKVLVHLDFGSGSMVVEAVPIGFMGDFSDSALLGIRLCSLAVCFAYFAWWAMTLRGGQTPGKQVVGIRVIRRSGERSRWGYTFVRECLVKFLLIGQLANVTIGVVALVNGLWPLWDSERMALHDKLLSTLVVRFKKSGAARDVQKTPPQNL